MAEDLSVPDSVMAKKFKYNTFLILSLIFYSLIINHAVKVVYANIQR